MCGWGGVGGLAFTLKCHRAGCHRAYTMTPPLPPTHGDVVCGRWAARVEPGHWGVQPRRPVGIDIDANPPATMPTRLQAKSRVSGCRSRTCCETSCSLTRTWRRRKSTLGRRRGPATSSLAWATGRRKSSGRCSTRTAWPTSLPTRTCSPRRHGQPQHPPRTPHPADPSYTLPALRCPSMHLRPRACARTHVRTRA